MAYLQYKAIKGLGLGTLKKLRAEAKKNAGEMSSNIKSPKFRSTEKIMKYKKQSIMAKSAAWQRKEGKNPKGGLNAKGRASYKRQTGGTLKAPSKKVGNKRRASFCARMSGMKKKLTSAKTARDPNSRINKSLRAWNC